MRHLIALLTAARPAVALNGIAPFGIQPVPHIRMDVLGLKVRVAGDAVLRFLDAENQGNALYASATKLFLAQSLLVNGTLAGVDLGQIVPGVTGGRCQTGYYLCGQVTF